MKKKEKLKRPINLGFGIQDLEIAQNLAQNASVLAKQGTINSTNPGPGVPQSYRTCTENVCCQVTLYYVLGIYVGSKTVCWNKLTNESLGTYYN